MISNFFINRPIVAMVIAIITLLGGLIAMLGLPLAQFPEIVPPQIIVGATMRHTGAGLAIHPQSAKKAFSSFGNPYVGNATLPRSQMPYIQKAALPV